MSSSFVTERGETLGAIVSGVTASRFMDTFVNRMKILFGR